MTRRRLQPNDRKKQILEGFILLAETKGYRSVTREEVADYLEISPALVTRYFEDSMNKLREGALTYASEFGLYSIVVQALILRDPLTANLPEEVKRIALNSIPLSL